MSQSYDALIVLNGRMQRRWLALVKTALERMEVRDINNIQALILYNIGDKTLTVGELTRLGCYHGQNVTHNLKKLLKAGYVNHDRDARDGRSYNVSLTAKGQTIHKSLDQMIAAQAIQLKGLGLSEQKLADALETLTVIDRFWANAAEGNDWNGKIMGGQ